MSAPAGWVETAAVVTSCRFQFARMNTLSLGIQRGRKFRIAFDYYAQGRLYSSEFQSPKAVPQGDRIPLAYNPANPRENTRSASDSPTRGPLFLVGLAGSLVLSLVWFALLRGCA